jgi:cytidine deaminase
MLKAKDRSRLLAAARAAAAGSYAPYSRFRVGAALLCDDGSIVTGANVENRSYGLTICAERNAVAAAVSMGKRRFRAVAVSCPDSKDPVPPCGACRQVLSEFAPSDTPVIFFGSAGDPREASLGDLLPLDSLHDLAGQVPTASPRPRSFSGRLPS